MTDASRHPAYNPDLLQRRVLLPYSTSGPVQLEGHAILGSVLPPSEKETFNIRIDRLAPSEKSRLDVSVRKLLDIPEGKVINGMSFPAGINPEFKHLGAAILDDVAENIDPFIWNEDNEDEELTKREILDRLPPDIPCCEYLEIFTIPDDDPREHLRGQLGVRVRTDAPPLQAGTFIGVYRGRVAFVRSYEIEGIKHGFQEELNRDAYAANVVTFNPYHEAVEAGEEFPAMSSPPWISQDSRAARCYKPSKDGSAFGLISTAHGGFGNLTCLVNDPSINPLEYGEAEGYLKANAITIEFDVGKVWTFPAMVLCREVKPGEEITYSYGSAYWELIDITNRRLEAEKERMEALKKQLQQKFAQQLLEQQHQQQHQQQQHKQRQQQELADAAVGQEEHVQLDDRHLLREGDDVELDGGAGEVECGESEDTHAHQDGEAEPDAVKALEGQIPDKNVVEEAIVALAAAMAASVNADVAPVPAAGNAGDALAKAQEEAQNNYGDVGSEQDVAAAAAANIEETRDPAADYVSNESKVKSLKEKKARLEAACEKLPAKYVRGYEGYKPLEHKYWTFVDQASPSGWNLPSGALSILDLERARRQRVAAGMQPAESQALQMTVHSDAFHHDLQIFANSGLNLTAPIPLHTLLNCRGVGLLNAALLWDDLETAEHKLKETEGELWLAQELLQAAGLRRPLEDSGDDSESDDGNDGGGAVGIVVEDADVDGLWDFEPQQQEASGDQVEDDDEQDDAEVHRSKRRKTDDGGNAGGAGLNNIALALLEDDDIDDDEFEDDSADNVNIDAVGAVAEAAAQVEQQPQAEPADEVEVNDNDGMIDLTMYDD